MNFLLQLMKRFSELQFRDRAIATAVGCILLVLGGNLVLLKPLQLEIDKHRAVEQTNMTAIAAVMKDLAAIDGQVSQGIDPFQKELAVRDELLRKIAEGEAFFAQHDATVRQVGSLVRSLLEETPGVSLVSFKTLPGQVFYSPPPPPPPPKATEKAAENIAGAAKLLKLEMKPEAPPPVVKPVALQKTIYKHGVEITVRGNYPQLVSYMEKLQKYPKRVFWSEAKVTAQSYPVSVLRIVIFTLSDRPLAPLE